MACAHIASASGNLLAKPQRHLQSANFRAPLPASYLVNLTDYHCSLEVENLLKAPPTPGQQSLFGEEEGP